MTLSLISKVTMANALRNAGDYEEGPDFDVLHSQGAYRLPGLSGLPTRGVFVAEELIDSQAMRSVDPSRMRSQSEWKEVCARR
jgi:hypothetical protein